ncbi:MAG: class I tRNA ligase family protein, partial [Acidimicrobiia bacterium]
MPSKASANTFTRVAPDVDFPALEDRILELWDETNAFAESVDRRPIDREFTFYDGPPFPTGSPHYGNLLAGVLKDVVPRYWTMRGYRVERRFGWDTHGLPIEMEVQQDLGLKGPADVERFGVDAFNEACRARVETNTETWEAITRRMGRWVDFENDYKTMDLDFMESVWWVFRQLWDKGLIYQAFKVLPYSYGATTPLSNFEAGMDYRDIEDPSITVRLRVLKDHGPLAAGDYLLIWTTTPWTLPGNLAIAVREDIRYVRIDDELEGKPGRYWLAADLVETYWQDRPEPATEATGDQLVGAFYEPPFDYFGEERDRGAFVVLPSDDVNTEEGTGLVHMAPSYGEADLLALQAAGLDVLVDPVDAEAKFTDEVPDVAGMHVKDADARLIELLDERDLLVTNERITHSYPFCWRTGTPLIYKAIPTWFVSVESFRERMVELNKRIHWVPEYVGSRRFGNWLAGARDWAISRNRYWGSCIPVWECDSCDELISIGSVAELEERSGVRLSDLHKQFVDPVTFPCSECQGT